MLDLRSELDNFNKIDIASLEEQGVPLEEDIRKSIVLYNKAIDSIRAKSEDIAIIELKKAISLNPHFYEALNLLGICYAAANDYERAKEMFQKVMQNEKNGLKSLEYMQNLFGEHPIKNSTQSSKKHDKKNVVKETNRKSNQSRYSKDNILANLDSKSRLVVVLCAAVILLALSFFAGFAAGAARNASSAKPGKHQNDNLKNGNKIDEPANNQNDYDRLKKDYEETKKQLELSFSEIIKLKNINKLYQAKELANNKNYAEAADMLQGLGIADFDNTMEEEYNKLIGIVMPKAAEQKFNEGLKLFNQKSFQEALKSFLKSSEYSEDFKDADRNLYYIGKCYMELSDSRNALETFKKLLEKYPQSRYASYSTARIRELSANP